MQHFVGRIWQGRTGTADLHELYSICSLARDLPPHCFSLLHFSTSSAFGSGSTGQAKQLNTAVLYGRQEPKKNTEESRQGGISCCASVSLLECCGAFMSSICAGFFPQFIYHLIQQKSPEQRHKGNLSCLQHTKGSKKPCAGICVDNSCAATN